jgi:phosphatidylserine decarboxylase
MVRDGIFYLIGFGLGGALVSWLSPPAVALPLGLLMCLLGLFCAWFFRDPERLLPVGPVALSPADGRVVKVVKEDECHTRISIFLNIFDVHVNRSPITGIITDITYRPGKFLVASREAASGENEQNIFTVRAEDGTKVVFKQIAGLIARRIVCTKNVGDFVRAGERVGMIKFGSRVDVIFGPEWRVEVAPGARVLAGSSVLARRADGVVITPALTAQLDEEPALCQT